MAQYRFEALDRSGKQQRGDIEAASDLEARQLIRKRGLTLKKLKQFEKNQHTESKQKIKALNSEETVSFLQQLSALLGAGVPLTECLGSIAEGMEKPHARQCVAEVRQQLLEGGALAQAMSSVGFDTIICNMVAAGEQTGQLEAVSTRLSELLEYRQALQQQILSAILYPAIIVVVGIAVVVFMLSVVVPQVVGVFAHANAELPLITRMMIYCSDMVQNYGVLMLLTVISLIYAYVLAMKKKAWRFHRDRLLLDLPLFRNLLLKMQSSSFCRTLGMLLGGGVPILTALHIANQSLTLLPIRQAGEEARDSMREGESLAKKLESSGYFPHLAIRLIDVGEQSGRLDSMLLKVADHYDEDSSRALKRLVTLLEPMMVLGMAVMVGLMALGILLPILEMNQLIR
ncbi:MAG: type II secretion system F family protein [Mariprofundaceae bacterium]|nr:type II secretion system F family protein [Mariprofundaceae bacterium]